VTSASTSAELESLRVLASQHGIPVDCIDRFAMRPGRVAHALDVSVRKVHDWIASGQIASIRVGGVVRVPVVDLLRFLERHRRFGVESPDAQRPRSLNERVEAFLDE
jgi:excisionase family DNA binding protein